jgi:hypothetical protein
MARVARVLYVAGSCGLCVGSLHGISSLCELQACCALPVGPTAVYSVLSKWAARQRSHAPHSNDTQPRRNATQVASHNLHRATAACSAACAIHLAVTSSSCALSFALSLKRPSSVYTKSPSFQSCRRAGACMQYKHHTYTIHCRICVVRPRIVPRIRRCVRCMRRAVADFRAACPAAARSELRLVLHCACRQ